MQRGQSPSLATSGQTTPSTQSPAVSRTMSLDLCNVYMILIAAFEIKMSCNNQMMLKFLSFKDLDLLFNYPFSEYKTVVLYNFEYYNRNCREKY
jgi:hypothetical protein